MIDAMAAQEKPNRVKPNRVKPNRVKPNRVKPNRVKPNRNNSVHMGRAADQVPPSVATRFQFGSRELTSLAKVQTSVTLVTASALPSITLPLRLRVADTSCETKRRVSCAILRRNSALMISVASMDINRDST